MIQFVNVSKEFKNGLRALDGVDIKVDNGEFVFIVGVSGAGKSTLVKLILKELEPTTGKLLVNDTDLSQMKRKEIPFYRRGIGVVFQDFRLLPEKTVYENVAFAMEVVEAGRKEIRRQVPAVLGMVGLAAKANSFPGQLSGGEQQRTALARALVNNPSILIADEPTGNLDRVTAGEIMKIINLINHRGTTVIMATHALEIVNSMKKRVITFQKGKIVSDDAKGEYFFED
ncbi:MAG: cell division ATP-binding protein FtsE [Clostridia bacterium]|nr:cell division ATP-binding protein FtsE [Clostridia bacterium]MDD4679698.1 cell division ATP-binding protein FtsE [Clostridia bacterium]